MEVQVQYVLAGLLGICFIIQLGYLLAQSKLNKYKPAEELPQQVVPVSVIICARNEAKNITELLPFILEQQHPEFEVVLVNDCSIDESKWILENLQVKYPHLKIVTVTESRNFKTGKKFALTMGIKAARYNNLLFTDADCRPASANWISRMAAHFQNSETQIILGYSPYYKTAGFLNALIRFETIKTAINYLSAALRGNAYMGVGRNLAYRKELFFSNKGFASHMHIMSGDDDLFVNQHATRSNTVIEAHPEAFTFSGPKASFGEWFKQKRRHMGAGKLYKSAHKRFLGTDAFTGLLFYALFFACLASKPALYFALGMLFLRWIVQMMVYRKQFNRLEGRELIWYLPFLDMVYYLYLNVFGLIGTLIKTTQWK